MGEVVGSVGVGGRLRETFCSSAAKVKHQGPSAVDLLMGQRRCEFELYLKASNSYKTLNIF